MRVNSQDEYANVVAASRDVKNAALTGSRYVPVIGSLDFQTLDSAQLGDVEQFSLAMSTLDNFRLSSYGLDNGGLFQKQGTVLKDDAEAAQMNTGLILSDGLTLRQNFCTIVNSLFGLSIWCEIKQPVTLAPADDMGADSTGDGDDHISEGKSTGNDEGGGSSDV